MAAQGLRDIGIGLGQLDQQLEQLADGRSGAAVFNRHPHCAKTCLLEPADRFMGQLAGLFAFKRAGGDFAKQRDSSGSPSATNVITAWLMNGVIASFTSPTG